VKSLFIDQYISVSFSLVIMAAGLGSRFGGVKQLAKVGKSGEAFLDFSIRDALSAEFDEVVMIVRSEIEADVREHVANLHPGLQVRYVRQDDLGPQRDKPWGTVHAVLSAKDAIKGKFAVINADDYYGASSYKLASEALNDLKPGTCANIAFELGNTVPAKGSVTRGVTAVEGGKLTAIVETEGCERLEDGTLMAGGKAVPNDTPVSMNLWCFDGLILNDFEIAWEKFLEDNADDPKAEVQLPTVVSELMNAGKLKVNIIASPEQWIGITNPEDFETAKAALADR